MSSLKKQTDLLLRLAEQDALPQTSNRIELKQVRSGHWRLYIAIPTGSTRADLKTTLDIAEAAGTWPNLFPSDQHVTALTFVDPDEHKK